MQDKIPTFALPLQPGDTEPIFDLQSLLNKIYNRARFHLSIDYNQEPVPQLKRDDAIWLDTFLRDQGLRNH